MNIEGGKMCQSIPDSTKFQIALLKLYNSLEECFIKFGKINDHIINYKI